MTAHVIQIPLRREVTVISECDVDRYAYVCIQPQPLFGPYVVATRSHITEFDEVAVLGIASRC